MANKFPMETTGERKEFTHIRFGITYVRTGQCNHCGKCCIHIKCPHYDDGCLIWDKIGQVCSGCSELRGKIITHEQCKDYPKHPFNFLVREKVCGFSFTSKTPEDEIKHQELEGKYGN